jgi:hypothetical protein
MGKTSIYCDSAESSLIKLHAREKGRGRAICESTDNYFSLVLLGRGIGDDITRVEGVEIHIE